MRICALGDLLLDVIVRLESPIAEDADAYGQTWVGAGGQAANVAAWAAALGGEGRFVGKRAADLAGRLVAEELRARGVELVGPEVAGVTGTVVSVASSDGRRTMLTSRGVAPELRVEELDPAWIEGCDWLHLPGYSLLGEPLRTSALTAAGLARQGGAQVSLDLSSYSAAHEAGVEDFRAACIEAGPAIVLASERERETVGELPADTWVVKRGAGGCSIETTVGRIELEARPVDVVDATGAGDAFAAGYLLGGADLALEAAARCVATMGAMPS